MEERQENMDRTETDCDKGAGIPIEDAGEEIRKTAREEADEMSGGKSSAQTDDGGKKPDEDADAADGNDADEDTDSAEDEDTDAADEDAADESEDAGKEDGEVSPKKEKSGLFRKKKDKRDEKIEELTDQVKRQMAEFENFRKRTEKEKSQMFDMGAKNVIEKILGVVDNFERGLAAVEEEQKEDPFVSGMDMIYKQLMTELDNLGVKPIECVGKEFDPALHNAVMQVESEEYETGIVAQELQKGYTYKDGVVRHSMVAVVQ